MGRSASGGRLPARVPAILASKTLAVPPDSDPRLTHKLHARRRIRNPAFPAARPRKAGVAVGGRRSGPTTPRVRWKFNDADRPAKHPELTGGKTRRKASNAVGGVVAAPAVSVRKLAAGMWHLMPPVAVAGGGGRARLGFEPVPWHLQAPYVCNPSSRGLHTSARNEFGSRIPVQNAKSGILHELEPAAALPNSAMERATKWDPGCMKASDEAYRLCSHLNALDGQQITTASFVSALHMELEQARIRIHELEAERHTSKRKVDHFLRKLAEEKVSWRSREHDKIRAIVDGMKDDLNRERKNRQRMVIVNSKLVNELAEAKLSAKRFLQDYEKEHKARELMEEVCDELAKEIGEDKAEVEALRRESMKIREEVEEERRMLQMAEVWREERVQMKLIDAKVTLEEKYSQVSKLKADLEAFLRARSSGYSDAAEIREAEMLREAAELVMVQEIKEFSYQPPVASEDIFAIFEELQPREETNEREIEQCYGYSPASLASKIHTVSPATDIFLEKPTTRYDNRLFQRNGDVEDDSGWETVSHIEEQGSSNSPAGSDPSVNGMCEESNALESGTDWEENGDNGTLNSEIIEVCSGGTRQSRKKTSSISKLWKSSCPNYNENDKKVSVEATNGRLANGRVSSGLLSPDRGSGESCLSPPSVGQWSSPDSVNPYITRGMKGCIEWPRGMQKHSLKAKLLEARMESQKIQLRHALKQKI